MGVFFYKNVRKSGIVLGNGTYCKTGRAWNKICYVSDNLVFRYMKQDNKKGEKI